MAITVSQQGELFLMSCLLGCCFAVAYDIFRAFRRKIPACQRLAPFLDFIYCLIVFLCLFAFMYVKNSGEPRLYIYLGVILTMLLYFISLSQYVLAAFSFIVGIIVSVIKFIFSAVAFPFKKLFGYIAQKRRIHIEKEKKKLEFKINEKTKKKEKSL